MAYQHHKTLKGFLILFFSLLVVFTVMSVVYLLGDQNNPNPFGFATLGNAPVVNNNVDITATTTFTDAPSENPCYLVPHVATTTENGVYTAGYGLFIQQTYDKPYEGDPCPPRYPVITYIDSGMVEAGTYAGYHRLVAFRTWDGPGGDTPSPYFFITKDYKTFKGVAHPLMTLPELEPAKTKLASLQTIVDKHKVTGLVDDAKDKINFPYPVTLGYGSFTYVLTRINVEIPPHFAEINDAISADPIVTDRSFGAFGYTAQDQELYKVQAQAFEALKKYYSGTTKIYRKDRTGIVSEYSLSLNPSWSPYPEVYTGALNMLQSKDIITKEKVYGSYGQSTPDACGFNPDPYTLQNVSESDLRKIGTMKTGVELYTFTNTHHPILEAQYIEKITQYTKDMETFQSLNGKNAKIPTYDEYVAKNPILIFKDFFGRYVALGEFNYQLEGGCGKPVIYLYPKTTTDVHIDFKNVVQLTTDIPSYTYGKGDTKGWNVQAEPDGSLHDLSDAAENIKNCNEYKIPYDGSEYAFEACKKNDYPYIYWAGNTFETYPSMKEGFVVRASKLKQTLQDKLTQIGLTEKETSDMIGYWYPEMIKKNSPFYRISFMQTALLNKFIPMNVRPKPDTMIRVFLDWEPLQESIPFTPQQLVKIPRTGFTYVEWGGLRR